MADEFTIGDTVELDIPYKEIAWRGKVTHLSGSNYFGARGITDGQWIGGLNRKHFRKVGEVKEEEPELKTLKDIPITLGEITIDINNNFSDKYEGDAIAVVKYKQGLRAELGVKWVKHKQVVKEFEQHRPEAIIRLDAQIEVLKEIFNLTEEDLR